VIGVVTQVAFSKAFDAHDTADHPENADRTAVMVDELELSPLFSEVVMVEPKMLPERLLFEVHSAEMIERVKEASVAGSWIDLDTYVSKNDYVTARLAAGAVLQLSEMVAGGRAPNAYALVRPPGHHASGERSMGFCLFNNAAIAAHALSKQGKKVLIFDHDVHHGNGTQSIFYGRRDVLYMSFHLSPHYPGTGAVHEVGEGAGLGYTVNAPLGFGMGDDVVWRLFDEIFIPVASQFKPDVILMSAGYDSHHADPLGGLRLTANSFGEMVGRLQKIQPKIVCTLEGGYNLSWLGKCFLSQIGVLTGHPEYVDDRVIGTGDVEKMVKEMKGVLGSYWRV
jgi:acetoin utilization deacetylase AcuC-like enzyme